MMRAVAHPANLTAFAALLTTATIYLSGPMTGRALFNFPAFAEAAMRLRAKGYAVVSPHEKDLEIGFDPASDGAAFDLRAALEWDILAVMASDAVVVLPGWEDSPGCAIEVTVAASYGLPVVTLDTALSEWDSRLLA